MARALTGLATGRQPAHGRGMERATKRPEAFRKPAYWSDSPPPAPGPDTTAPPEGEAPGTLSPTRYGDWVKKGGLAVDF